MPKGIKKPGQGPSKIPGPTKGLDKMKSGAGSAARFNVSQTTKMGGPDLSSPKSAGTGPTSSPQARPLQPMEPTKFGKTSKPFK